MLNLIRAQIAFGLEIIICIWDLIRRK